MQAAITHVPKEFRPGVRLAMDQGWTLEIRSHIHLVPPFHWDDGNHVTVPCTPSDRRAHKNFMSLLRQRGIIVKEKKKS